MCPSVDSASARLASASNVALRSPATSAASSAPRSGGEVTLAQALDRSKRADELSERCLLGEREQLVGGAGHRRDDDDGSSVEAGANNVDEPCDRGRIADGCATELRDDHGTGSSP